MIARGIIVLLFASMTAGAGYLSWSGVWGESNDLDRSIRAGSAGGGYYAGGSVK